MSSKFIRTVVPLGALALLIVAGCGKQQTVDMSPSAYECAVLSVPDKRVEAITVALLDPVEPGSAPWPQNASERLLFNQLYETLITVDCTDHVQRGLAESWSSRDGGRRWTFELRKDARFWDGTRVTALDVEASWQDALTLETLVDSVTVGGERTLHVHLKKRYRRVPRAFCWSAFAVTKPLDDTPWRLGTGWYRVAASAPPGRGITTHPAFRNKGPTIHFLETSTARARDLIEEGIDLMVTTEPSVIEYAAGRTELVTMPLPWDRTYVLLSTSRVQELRRGGSVGTLPDDFLERLARDAVRGDARGYQAPSWWDDVDDCDELSFSVSTVPPVLKGASSETHRVLYDSRDSVARDLAERIVALATTNPTRSTDAATVVSSIPGLVFNAHRMMAHGVTGRVLDVSLRRGDDFAYVIAVPRRSPNACYEARELVDRAPWLRALNVDLPEAMIPLIDLRPHAIARSERVGLLVDWYGGLVIANESMEGR